MKRSKSSIGGEQSGHIIISNYSNTGDGILAALKITGIMTSNKTKASKLFNLYKNFYQKKINLIYKNKNRGLIKILNDLKKDRSLNNKNLRSLVRFSGTEPLVRILVEGLDKNIVKKQSVKIKSIALSWLINFITS